MTSPASTAPEASSPAVTRRSRRPVRLAGGVLVIAAVALAAAACTPQQYAQYAVTTQWGTQLAPCADRIVQRESNFQPTAVNPSSGTTGLFQLSPVHATWIKSTFGYDFSQMKDAMKNAQVAKALFNEAARMYGDGWQPWRLSSRAVPGGGCPA